MNVDSLADRGHAACRGQPSTVLFLAANPGLLARLELGEECRSIEEKIRAERFRDQLRFRSRWAARPDDLLQALNEDSPTVLHFSGHGAGDQGLCFQADDGSALHVSADCLAKVLRSAGANVSVVLLNACYSEAQARILVGHVPCVIGMPAAIGDGAAIVYVASFYRALAFGRSVANAHEQGIAALALPQAHGPARDIDPGGDPPCNAEPRLLSRPDSDPERIYVVQGANRRTRCTLVIKATIDDFNADVLARVTDELRRWTGDLSLQIVDVEQGSVRLQLELSVRAARVLVEHTAGAEVARLCGFEIRELIPEPADVIDGVADGSSSSSHGEQVRGPLGALADTERAFYRRLLDLGGKDEIEPLLDEALALIVEATGASTAYLELYDDEANRPQFWKGFRCTDRDVASIRASISRGIIARAIGEGRTIETPSASLDARFSGLGSVRQNLIQAVLCVPVGAQPPIGVIYLQGRTRPGMFTSTDRERAELFARQLAPLADRLVRHVHLDRLDHTREVREQLRCPEIIGRSRALAQLLQSASHVAPLDVDVLITGPSGTGKSMLARAIHSNSPRAGGPFVELNCAAIPEALIENELFGAERGAHWTATRKVTGKVSAAEGGTLFLDEVAELAAGAQAKLLQLLETREYYPLGSSTTIRADVRILSATNAKLEERVAAKQFREDLFYRMHVVPLEVPGLGERRDDIPELVEHFCVESCRLHRLGLLAVSRRALAACRDSPWPGHTRQLAHAIEAAVIRAHGERSTTLHEQHIFPKASRDEAQVQTLEQATRQFQRRTVLEALEKNDWNVAETARQLDLPRSHLYNLINDFELRREDRRDRTDDQLG